MTDEKRLDENTLEGVAGGVFKMPYPVISARCPCGADVLYDANTDRVQCSGCGRWFRVVDGKLILE